MAEPIIVLLIVVAGAAQDRPHSAVVGAGIREALGGDARVLYEEREVEPSDEAARSLGAEINVGAVAEMKWRDRDRSRAMVRVYVAADDAFFDREITFRKTDAAEEREKSVGLLIGAMVRAATTTNAAASPVATELDTADASAEAAAPAPASTPRAVPIAPASPPARENREPSPSPRAPAAARAPWRSIDVSATGALAVGGVGSGVGPSVAGQAFLVSFLAVRASAAARLGSIETADASSTTLRFGVGPAFRALGNGANDRVALQIAIEALAVDQAVTRSSPAARRDRWLPGSYATVQLGYRMSPVVEPYVGFGVETVFGVTPIVLDGTTEAVLPRARITADAGARVHF